jgi:hypothetical protein
MPLAGQRQKKFQLVDQGDNPYLRVARTIAWLIEDFNRLMAVGGLFLINLCRCL